MPEDFNENVPKPDASAPVPPPFFTPAPPRVRVPTSTRDFVFAIVTLIFSVIAANLSVYGSFNLGFAVSYVVLAIITLVYIKQKAVKIQSFNIYCGICAGLCVAVFPIYCDEFSKILLFFAVVALSEIFLGGLTGIQKYSSKSYKLIFDILRVCIVVPLDHMGDMFRGIFSSGEGDSKGKKSGIMIGIACALPVLLVVIPLLVSSDAAFEGIVNSVFSDVARLMGSIFFGIIIFAMLFSLSFAIVKGLSNKEPEMSSHTEKTKISVTTINTFLCTISLVYLIYLFSQLAYFFNAFSSVLPENYTLAEYARRGFFEMSIICGINLMLVFGSLVSSQKESGKNALSTRLISLFICAFSLILIGTVASKMAMYISEFGMTRLRILTSVFMLVLCFIFLFTIIKLFAHKFSYMKYIVIAVTVIGISVSFADIDRVIAKYNTEMYLNGYLKTIDVSAFSDLSDSAVPYLVVLLDDDNDYVALNAKNELISRIGNYYYVTNDDNCYDDIRYDDYYNKTDNYYDTNNVSYTEIPTGFKFYNYSESVAKKLIYDNVIKNN